MRRIGEEEAKDQLAAASLFLDTVIERLQSMPVGTIDQDAERKPWRRAGLGRSLRGPSPTPSGRRRVRCSAVRSSPLRRGGVNERRRQRSLTMRPPSRG